MQDQQPTRKRSVGIVAGISAAVVAAGSGTAWWAWNSFQPEDTSQAPNTSQIEPSAPKTLQSAPQTQEQGMDIYWLKTEGNEIEMVASSIKVPAQEQNDAMLEKAFDRLLLGTSTQEQGLTTTIPKGTKLLSIATKENGVYLDLSEEFASGGGTASMMGRLAQVLYTATSLEPNAPVWISVSGEPLEVLGGEGVLVQQPMTRQDFTENFEL